MQLGPYLLLVLFMILLAMLYTRTFYGMVHVFHRLPLRHHFRPAIGAFLTGLVGFVLYYLLRPAGHRSSPCWRSAMVRSSRPLRTEPAGMSIGILLAIALGKILTTSLTIGSGGSGGVFGPSMVIGGCGGGALGMCSASPLAEPGAASGEFRDRRHGRLLCRRGQDALLDLDHRQRDDGRLSPAPAGLWVCVLAFLLSDEKSIYSAQVESRSRSPAHQGSFVRDVLEAVYVRQFLVREQVFHVVRPGDSLAVMLDRLDDSQYTVLPVVDAENRLLGVVDLEEAHLAAHAGDLGPLLVAEDLMRSDVRPLTPDDTLDRALELFVENDVMALPIVADLRAAEGDGHDPPPGDRQRLPAPRSRPDIKPAGRRKRLTGPVSGNARAKKADRKMESRNMKDGGNSNCHVLTFMD